jgi:hypothetical protein
VLKYTLPHKIAAMLPKRLDDPMATQQALIELPTAVLLDREWESKQGPLLLNAYPTFLETLYSHVPTNGHSCTYSGRGPEPGYLGLK